MSCPSSRTRFIFNHSALTTATLGAALLMGLSACGGSSGGSVIGDPGSGDTVNTDPGGGSSGGTTVQTATGVFLDSAVSGLAYRSGSQSGMTGADGAFTYEVGQPVVFSLGGVTFGSASGKDIVMPIDLVENGSGSSPAVVNITRFLMMLDSDGKPGNGITVSPAVQAAAASWSQPDFSQAGDAFTTAVDSIVNEVSSADGDRLAALPTDADAQAHLASSFNCAHSGAYWGTLSGDLSGNFAAHISGKSGKVVAIHYAGDFAWTSQNKVQALSQDAALSFSSNQPITAANTDGTGTAYAETGGNLDGADGISGSWTYPWWSNTAPSVFKVESGSFSGTRLADPANAVYRFTLRYKMVTLSPDVSSIDAWGVIAFGVDADNRISGQVYSVLSGGTPVPVTGTVSGLNVSIDVPSSGDSLTATLNKDLADKPQNVRLDAEYSTGADTTLYVNGRGCKLNPWLMATP